MIDALKGEDIVNKIGGRFKLTALIQHRVRELMEGARPLVERKGRNEIEIAIAEISEGKIALAYGSAADREDDDEDSE